MYQPKYTGNNQIANEVNVRTIKYCISNTGSYCNLMIKFMFQQCNLYISH